MSSLSYSARPQSLARCRGVDFLDSSWRFILTFLFLSALAIRIIFLFIAPNNTTDAWSRYMAATIWLQHPLQLPPATASDAWLPMQFWLLGAVVWITKSEMAARIFSVLLGSLTVVLLAGIADRAFNRRVALGSAVLLPSFGFHIAFSVTTSSESLTVFLMALGTYAWIRYAPAGSWWWAAISSAAFNVAALCRFEPWLCAPTLAFMLLFDDSGVWPTRGPSLRAWSRALGFGLLSSAGALGWLVFSYLKWGDPLELPHRTMWLNQHFQPSHHSLLFRFVDVPGSLVITFSPVIALLALIGIVRILFCGSRAARAIVILSLVLLAFNYYSSIKYETTQARYTLLYSWLFFPFAAQGLMWISARLRWQSTQSAFAAVITFFFLWQIGIAVGANYAPRPLGDHLGALSPMIPLHAELRGITKWLRTNGSQHGAVILDDYNWESSDIFRFGRLRASSTFSISQQDYDDQAELNARLERFVGRQHPGLLICSPEGPIGKTWCTNPDRPIHAGEATLSLASLWSGEHWQIYGISYQQ